MKTSNILLLTAALLLLTTLTAYNLGLRAEYRRGTYKDPLREYSTLNFNNFDEIDVPAASSASVNIVAGPFGVRLSPWAAKYVRLRQQGQRLVVTAAFPKEWRYLPGPSVVISCPRLARLRTDAVYEEAGKVVTENKRYERQRVLVQGFGQDSLRLRADRASRVELTDNRLGYLAAEVGPSPGSHAALLVNDKNQLSAANLHLEHQSELTLNGVRIPSLRYQVGDSVQVSLTGAALNSLLR